MIIINRSLALTFTILSLSILCSAQVFPAHEGEFKTEYDRFTDKTRVNLLLLQVAEKQYEFDYQRLYLTVASEFDSQKPTRKPDFVVVFFASWSLFNNRYKESAPLNAIIDGERKSYGEMVPINRLVINGKYVATVGNRMS